MSFARNTFRDGETFEKFVEEVIFPASHFVLLHKTHSHQQNSSRFVWSSLKPDFTFKSIASGKLFHIEAKFRSRYNADKIELLTDKQYHRYNKLDRPDHPVFILLGTEGYPDKPKMVSLIPMKAIRHLDVHRSIVNNHSIPATICPEYVLSGTQKPRDYVSPILSDIASGLTYTKKRTKQRNYLAWVLGILVIGIFTAFFITESSGAEDKIPDVSVREKLQEYYDALELNNTEVLDYYLHEHLDRWYDHHNVSLAFVKNNAEKYNKKYPIRQIDILWPSYQEHVLPNGDISLSYDVDYQIKSKPSQAFKKYKLVIKSIWSPNLRIKSMYEIRANKLNTIIVRPNFLFNKTTGKQGSCYQYPSFFAHTLATESITSLS